MNKKPGIPLVAIIIFFALIIGIIVTCIIILTTQSGKDQNKSIKLSDTTTENTSNDNEVKNNAIVKEEDTDDNGEEIDLNSSDVSTVFGIIGNQSSFAKYATYKLGEFDNSNISNELKLKLAISTISNSEIEDSDGLRVIPKETIDNHLVKVFGNSDDIDYVDVNLFDDNNFNDSYAVDKYIYNQDEEWYEIIEENVNINNPSLVNEMILKAVKYNNKLELYVVPLFIKTFILDDQNNFGYQFYSEYDFSNKDYSGEMFTNDNNILAITSDTFNDAVLSNDDSDVDGLNNDTLISTIKDFDSLQKYKYTFKYDEDTGKYTLESFKKADNSELNQNNNDNNSDNNDDNNDNNDNNNSNNNNSQNRNNTTNE